MRKECDYSAFRIRPSALFRSPLRPVVDRRLIDVRHPLHADRLFDLLLDDLTRGGDLEVRHLRDLRLLEPSFLAVEKHLAVRFLARYFNLHFAAGEADGYLRAELLQL